MKGRIFFSGLNGIRAIAALAVVFSHITIGLNEFGLDSYIFGRYPDGNPKATLLAGFGVSIFFALSGFLITFLLLEERKTGDIHIRNFYLRRILRIWPLYYLVLILTLVTTVVFHIQFEGTFVPFYVLLFANIPFILGRSLPMLAHYWSLGVEEQFYSFWPWIIKKSASLLRLTVMLCVGLLGLKIAARLIDIKMNNGVASVFYDTVHVTRFPCMLVGAIGAILYHRGDRLFLKLVNTLFVQGLCWCIILLVAVNQFHVASFIDAELISVVALCLIIGQAEKTKRLVNLDIPVFDFIGKISYRIYVIHPLVIFYLSKIIFFPGRAGVYNYILVYVAVYAATFILSYISYFYFEKRFLDLKDRYSTIKSSGARNYTKQSIQVSDGDGIK